MRKAAVAALLWLLFVPGFKLHAEVTRFHHIIVVVQENRTPDGLFQGLCLPPYENPRVCGTTDLQAFYNFLLPSKKFVIPTTVPASFFLNDTRPP